MTQASTEQETRIFAGEAEVLAHLPKEVADLVDGIADNIL